MLKVLIADDEINIGKLIKNLIDWESLDLELIAISIDSSESLEIILKEHPDIVITDIRMPGMTGLELIKETISHKLDTKFIVISGYTYFDYARTAIKYGVEDFLLKPINKEELQEALEKLIEKIKTSHSKNEQAKRIELDMTMSHQKVRKAFLKDLYHNKKKAGDLSLTGCNKEYYFSFKEGIFQAGIIHLDHKDVSLEYVKNILKQLSKRFHNELIQKCYEMELVELESGLTFLLNYAPESADAVQFALKNSLNEMLNVVLHYDFLKLTFCLGIPSRSFSEIMGSMFSAECAVNSRLVLGTNQIIYASELDLHPKEDVEVPFHELFARLRGLLEVMDIKASMELLQFFLQEQEGVLKQYPYSVLDRIKSIANSILSILKDVNSRSENISFYYDDISSKLDSCSSYDELISCFLSCISDFLSVVHSQEDEADLKKLKIAKKYIDDHYNEHLQLDDVAKQVYLNPAYFGIFFKKETGVNFSEYLLQLRMDHAKEMLKDIKYNISEIAEYVGYKDTRYFSKQFKKYTGVKPSEYRKIYHK